MSPTHSFSQMRADILGALPSWRKLSLQARIERLCRWANGVTERLDLDAQNLIAGESGLSPEMIAWGVKTTCGAIRPEGLKRLLEGVQEDSSRGFAVFPQICGHVWASTLPTSGWIPLVGTLILGSGAILKTPRGTREAAHWLIGSLEEAIPELCGAIRALSWVGGGEEDAALVQASEAVLISGGAQAVQRYTMLSQADPQHPVETVSFGPGYSIAVVPSSAVWNDALFASLALDIAAYDQRGCLSPQSLWLEEESGDPEVFCQKLSEALSRIAHTHPRGKVPTGAAAEIMQRVGIASFMGKVYRARDATVLLEVDGGPAHNPLYRTIPVHVYSGGPEGLFQRLGQRLRIQSAAVAGGIEAQKRYASGLSQQGANRVCAPGTMQTPPVDWHHDGFDWLARVVRYVDLS